MNEEKWSLKPGDDMVWAKQGSSDCNWQKVFTNFGEGKQLKAWLGIGWFRLWIAADTALTRQKLGLRINQDRLFFDKGLK